EGAVRVLRRGEPAVTAVIDVVLATRTRAAGADPAGQSGRAGAAGEAAGQVGVVGRTIQARRAGEAAGGGEREVAGAQAARGELPGDRLELADGAGPVQGRRGEV